MAGLFGGLFGLKLKAVRAAAPPPTPPPTPLPTMDDATVASRRNAALKEQRTRRGRRATLLSSGPLSDAPSAGGYKPLLS